MTDAIEGDGPEITALLVGPDDAGQRLDKILARQAERDDLGLSRTRLQDLIAQGFVRLDGIVALSPSLKPKQGARILFEVPPPVDATPQAEAIPLSVVFEDDDVIVLDKPAGLVVHPAPGHLTGTLVNALLSHCGDSLSGIGGVRRPGIVHRLDKDTTGLMVAAKSDRAHRGLADIFADHGRSGSLLREYRAFVWGQPDRGSGTIDAALGRHAHHRDRMAVVSAAKGRHAVTHWSLEERYAPAAALIRCRLETGRTHQIRVHMAHIGHPLIADPVYAGGVQDQGLASGRCVPGCHRGAGAAGAPCRGPRLRSSRHGPRALVRKSPASGSRCSRGRSTGRNRRTSGDIENQLVAEAQLYRSSLRGAKQQSNLGCDPG